MQTPRCAVFDWLATNERNHPDSRNGRPALAVRPTTDRRRLWPPKCRNQSTGIEKATIDCKVSCGPCEFLDIMLSALCVALPFSLLPFFISGQVGGTNGQDVRQLRSVLDRTKAIDVFR